MAIRQTYEQDLAQHVYFDTGRKSTQLGIIKKIEKLELSQPCAKDLSISEETRVTSLFYFHSRVFLCVSTPP